MAAIVCTDDDRIDVQELGLFEERLMNLIGKKQQESAQTTETLHAELASLSTMAGKSCFFTKNTLIGLLIAVHLIICTTFLVIFYTIKTFLLFIIS